MMNVYRTMHHRGGLKEAFKTLEYINPDLATYLIEKKIYKKYAYDERIKAKRYIFKEMGKHWNYEIPEWLLEFDEEETINEIREKFKQIRG